MNIRFKKWNCTLSKSVYHNNHIVLKLNDAEDGTLILVATVNVPEEDIEKDEVIIKDYSENTGIYKTLVDAGVISEYSRKVKLGFVEGLVCKYLNQQP